MREAFRLDKTHIACGGNHHGHTDSEGKRNHLIIFEHGLMSEMNECELCVYHFYAVAPATLPDALAYSPFGSI